MPYNEAFAIAIKSFSAYVQDSWKISPRLVLTFGTRWELDPPPNGKNGKHPYTATGFDLATNDFSNLTLAPAGTPLYNTTYGNFAPRLGFSYVARPSVNYGTVIRGGSGIFCDIGQGGFGNISFPYQQFFFLAPGHAVPGYPVYGLPVSPQYATAPPPDLTTSPSNPASATVAVQNYKMPRIFEYNLTLQQSLGSSVFSLAYVGSSAHALQRTSEYFFNQGPGLPASPNFSELEIIGNGSASNYNSLQAQFQSHLRKTLDMQLPYTWSHAIDNGISDSEPDGPDPRV